MATTAGVGSALPPQSRSGASTTQRTARSRAGWCAAMTHKPFPEQGLEAAAP